MVRPLLIVLTPLLILFIFSWVSDWSITPGGASPTVSDIWSIAGGALGYLGVAFSAYAAYKVKDISDRFFAKTRLPQIKRNIDRITGDMASAGRKTAPLVRKEIFLSSIAVSLGEVDRVPGHGLKPKIKRAEAEYKSVISWINSPINDDKSAGDYHGYWDLHRTIQEISQEISAHIKDQEAR